MLQILGHAHLPHELFISNEYWIKIEEYTTNLVLVTVHPRQCTNMREDILQRICELERIDISKTKLHMSIDDELGKPKNLATQVKCISETRLLTLFCGQGPKEPRLEGLLETKF